MIKEVKMYTVVCDRCGTDANEGGDYAAWSDKGYAEDEAMENVDWVKINGKHYCHDCWQWSEDESEQVPKPPTA